MRRRLLLLLLALAATGCNACRTRCHDSSGCFTGWVCEESVCKPGPKAVTCAYGLCTFSDGAPPAPTKPNCSSSDVATQEATCVCSAKTDCANGNTAKWACTPWKKCIQICTRSADCGGADVCEDLICRPPACGEDSECSGTSLCIGGTCTTPPVPATCAVAPEQAVLNAGGTARFHLILHDRTGAPIAWNDGVAWGSTGLAASTTDTGSDATFSSAATTSAKGTVTATVGGLPCAPASVTEYAPASDLRVVVASDGAAIADATVVVDGALQTTNADGIAAFPAASGAHTVSVFKSGYAYVTVVGTTATDLLIPLTSAPHPGTFKGQFKFTDFNNLAYPTGTLHLDVTGASLGGNLIDASLSSLLGPPQAMTISLGTGTPYGPFQVPEGIALGLGIQMFGDAGGGGRYGAVASPGYRALWSIGGNAVIGDVLKAIGPLLDNNGGPLSLRLPTVLIALTPIISTLESAVTTGLNVKPDEPRALSFGGAQPSLKLDTLPRLHLHVKTAHLPSFVRDDGTTGAYDAVVVLGGALKSPEGFVPLGVSAGIDSYPLDQITDGIPSVVMAGEVWLRLAPRHGGLEHSPWAFLTLGSSLKDLLGESPGQGLVLSGNIRLAPKGSATPYELKYDSGQATIVDATDDFLGVPDRPTLVDRTVSFAAAVPGATFHRLDVGGADARWSLYFPAGTLSVSVPTVPAGFDDRWVGTPSLSVKSVSLGSPLPGETAPITYDRVWQFDGTEADDLSLVMDRFSVREVLRSRAR